MAIRIPTVRRRFAARATYLHGHPPFLVQLAEARRGWNDDHPAYALSDDGWPPDPPFHPGNRYVYPPRLADALDDANSGGQASDDALWDASSAWRQVVMDLCAVWWPAEDFPVWIMPGAGAHPASRFVSASLVWDHKAIDAEWIDRFSQAVTTLRHGDRDVTVAYIFPGMTRADWNALAEPALQASRAAEDAILERGRELLGLGMSDREVAGRLGLARATIAGLRSSRPQ